MTEQRQINKANATEEKMEATIDLHLLRIICRLRSSR
jgi:hypothetical protein